MTFSDPTKNPRLIKWTSFCEIRLNMDFDPIVYWNKYKSVVYEVCSTGFFLFFFYLFITWKTARHLKQIKDNNWRKKGARFKTNSFFFDWFLHCSIHAAFFWNTLNTEWNSLFFVDFSDFFMIFLDAIERQRTRNTNGNYFLKILQHFSDVVVEQRRFCGFFWWIFLFFSSDCICFSFRFVF